MRYRSFIGPLTTMIVPLLIFEILRRTEFDLLMNMPKGHFYIVSSVSLLSAAVAFVVGLAGVKLRNTQVTFLSLAFLSLSAIFAVHGLSTPFLLIHATHVAGFSSTLSLIVATFWLWLSALNTDHPLVLFFSKGRRVLLPAWTAAVFVLGAVLMLLPDLTAHEWIHTNFMKTVVATITIALNVMVMYRYYRSYLYSRFPFQLAIVYSSGMIIVSQFIMVVGELWRASWWLYHFVLLVSMLVMLWGLKRQYQGSLSVSEAFRALFTDHPVERVTSSLQPSIKALMAATEEKDPYTAGHNLRVTLYAIKIAEEMKLRPEQLRALAQGTIVHDVGKINVPDAVLNKPGRLSAEERAVVELHPVKGYEMCRGLGFMKEELDIIRWHHERWSGGGYPDNLRGEQIPLMARIVAVADVYDALTSNRAYRKAMSHMEAMEILMEQRGEHFDPACIDAWIRTCEKNPSQFPLPSEEVAAASESAPKLSLVK